MKLSENEKRDAIKLIYIATAFDLGADFFMDIFGNDTGKIVEVSV